MDKKHALLLAFLITALIAGNYLFFADTGTKRENVKIVRVLDGDTAQIEDGRKIRFANINTPEKGLAYSDLAKNYVLQFLGKPLELENLGNDKYGRTLGRLYSNNEYINLEIIKKGFAHTYIVFEDETDDFSKAEEYARENKIGIWELSPDAGCITAKINKYEEYVNISDSCDVDFTAWTLKDESTKLYHFSKDMGDEFTIYSSDGKDTVEKLYWGQKKVWNDDKDRIFIRDANGLLAFYDSYGY